MSQAEAVTPRATKPPAHDGQRIAVLVPCFNEEASIAKVVADFRVHLPASAIYVYDNNSADRTFEIARAAGAIVRREPHRGKGYVVRRMFADVEADIYVLVDGDATYDAPSARALVQRLLDDGLDMVVACAHRLRRRRLSARPSCRQPGSLRLLSRACSAAPSPICSLATGCFPAALSNRFRRSRAGSRSRPSSPFMRSSSGCRWRRLRALISRGRWIPLEAAHLAGRPAHSGQSRGCTIGTAVDFFLRPGLRLAVVSVVLAVPLSSPIWRKGWCRACRPQFWPPG